MAQTDSNRTGRVAQSTLIVMGGFALGIVFGLIRQRVIAATFGTSAALDAFGAANPVPELLFNMLSGGALGFAFIPVYTDLLSSKDSAQANRLFVQVVNAVFILISLICLIVGVFAPILVRTVLLPSAPPEQQILTAALLRILLIGTVIFSVSSIVSGALHAHQHFLFPVLAPIVYVCGIIFGAVVLSPTMGVYGLAWGAVIGAGLHLLVQVPAAIHHRILWQPIFSFDAPELRRVAILMAPRIVDLFLARTMLQVLPIRLISGLGEGRIAALGYAYTLMNMPWTLIGTAIGIAVFPTMAVVAARKDVDAQRQVLNGTLRAILALTIPAAVGLIVLGRPIIQVLLEGGEFTPESTELVYFALQFYTLTLISNSMLDAVVRSFAAQEDTFTPLLVSLVTTTLNIGLAIWLVNVFAHGGPPLANGIAVGVESLIGLTILHRRWGGIHARRLLLHTGKAIIAAAGMAGAVTAIRMFLDPSPLMMLVIGGGVGAIVYFGLALVLGIDEIRALPLNLIQSVLRRKKDSLTAS